MKPQPFWREEYRREVEAVLAQGCLSETTADVVELQRRIQVLEEKLQEKTRRLDGELRRRGRLKSLALQFETHLKALEREASRASALQERIDELEARLEGKD